MVRLLALDLKKRCKASASTLALACCSKKLSGVILDSLWEEFSNHLIWLLRCLPPETWEIHDDEFVSAIWVHSHSRGTHLINRFSYVAPLPKNGSDSRAMLVGSASFTRIAPPKDHQTSHRQRIIYYLCRLRFWVLIFCQTYVPSIGSHTRGTNCPSSGCSSIQVWLT